ncbi:hypothetical protein H2509_04220 [Stappia sp. F7233]|uniref:Uncharacterized protein n=1 Tax=Stappia albiluteola TaxID=2758565 RepID=A0A839ABA7_9HYPH|nr:hypothetical protein [Stappia albiluteola]MBA5776328.1 hypothetical protein [Stappia albiluteola]
MAGASRRRSLPARDDQEVAGGLAGRTPRPFAIGYRKGAGEALVYGALVAGLLCVVAAVLHGSGLILLGVLPAGFCAYRFYPMVETRTPQLGANAEGLFVEGIGFIYWQSIAQVDLFQTSVRNIRLAALRVTLNGSLEDSLAKRLERPSVRMLMTRSWKVRRWPGGDGLEVELHPLDGDPHEILERVRDFLPLHAR